MTLASWLSREEISDADFAERIGVSRQALWRYKSCERVPRPEIMARIHVETGGAVTANDFFAPATESAA
jgi:transcriptional regulator with XRE-family HTH domain